MNYEGLTEERLQEIREAFADTTILRDRHRADPAIGELLAEVDRLNTYIENWADWV